MKTNTDCKFVARPWEFDPPLWRDVCKHPGGEGRACDLDNCPLDSKESKESEKVEAP